MIGRRTSYLDSVDDARGAIAGFVLVNDVSERAFQMERSGQWSKGKSAETFNPTGPWLATPDEIDDVLGLGMWLDVNGVSRQRGSTATMVFDPFFIVHHLSQFMVLEPGDLIDTGTPPGRRHGLRPAGLAGARRRDGAGDRRARHPAPARDRATLRCARSWSPVRASPASRTSSRPRPDPARSSWTSPASVSAAPTWSCIRRDGLPARGATRTYPLRLGHEWCGTVAAVGPGVDECWLGRRVTGDTHARLRTLPSLPDRTAVRLRGPLRDRHPRRLPRRAGRAAVGAGERPAAAARRPSTTWPEPWSNPGGNALRAVRRRPGRARRATADPRTGHDRAARGAASRSRTAARSTWSGSTTPSLEFAKGLGVDGTWTPARRCPTCRWDGVIDASNHATSPLRAAELVGRRPPHRLHRALRDPEPHRHPHAGAQAT